MTTRQVFLDVSRCLRAVAAPLLTSGVLTLGVLALARTAHHGKVVSTSMDELVLLVWRGGTSAALVWLVVAVSWAATRPRRDRRAFQRLQHLRESAAQPNRALVHVQTAVWCATAGQHVVVVNVATGSSHRVWLPETTVSIGAFVVLERTSSGVRVVDWMNAHQVDAGHRHERRHVAHHITSGVVCVDPPEHVERDDARQLIEETEQFLKEQESRW